MHTQATKTSLFVRVEMTVWIFYFAIQLYAQIGAAGDPGSITLRLEAGSRVDQDVREKISRDVNAKIDEWERNGHAALESAQGQINYAEKKCDDADAHLRRVIGNLEREKRELHR